MVQEGGLANHIAFEFRKQFKKMLVITLLIDLYSVWEPNPSHAVTQDGPSHIS